MSFQSKFLPETWITLEELYVVDYENDAFLVIFFPLGFSEAGVFCYQVTHNLRYKISNIQPDQYYKFACIH